MKTLLSLIAVVTGLTACGSAAAPAAHPRTSAPPVAATAAPTPSSRTGPLLAVLQGAVAGRQQADMVALVGLDGHLVAKATFQPRTGPYMPMAAMMVQSEAQVGTAGVYYADGSGVIRMLTPSGATNVVATFPMSPDQHELWYSVSPDGDRLLAGVLSLPAVVPPPPGKDVPPTLAGGWKFDLESANAGGPTRVLRHFESAGTPLTFRPILPAGWTQDGPVAMVGAPIATQNEWFGGPLFQVDEAGQPTTRVGGSDCTGAQVLSSGTLACVTDGFDLHVTIRDASGRTLWTPSVDGFNALALKLAPSGDAITDQRNAATASGFVTLPDGFVAQGWLDSHTVVGRQSDGELASVSLDSPKVVHSLGVMGTFVGSLPGR
jgi:hypothetical protein